MNWTNEQLFHKLKTDVDFFCYACLSVIDKVTNKEVIFKLNKVQKFYSSRKSKFDIILKSRKGGISTYIIAEALHKCIFGRNEKAVLLCQNEDATNEMFNKRVIPMLKSSILQFPYKISKSYGLIEFPATNSTFRVGTAGSLTFGRGSDITFYHLSEAAYYQSPDVLTSIEEACLETAVGRIETTANGMNFFYKMWKNAEVGNSKYNPVFIPWVLDDTYRIRGIEYISDLTKEEQELKEVYKLDYEQIAWRRQKIKEMSRPEYFNQEYPLTPSMAFISSGKLFFDWITLSKHEQFCQPPKWRGFLKDMGETGIQFEPQAGGNLSIWEMPQPNHIYIIGADVGEGIKGGSYSTAFVLDVNTMSQVAEYCAHIPPTDFADVLVTLSMFYNRALLCPEAWPGPGQVTINEILKTSYYNIYKRERSQYSHKKEDQLWGWETTRRTKQDMMYVLYDALKEFRIKIKSSELIYELRSMIIEDNRIEPQEGCFSDRVIACAIAYYVCRKYGYEQDTSRKILSDIFIAQNEIPFVSYVNFKSKPYGRR